MNICIISGSARQDNNTLRVAKALSNMLHLAGQETLVVDFSHYDIPLINQGDISTDPTSLFQQTLLNGMANAQAIIIVTPEYNWSTTPEILNWLHRYGDKQFAHLFQNKVFAFLGVSTGKGGKAPALHLQSVLNKIISFADLNSIVSAKIFESHYTKEVLNEDGSSLGNALFDKGLNDFVNYTVRITKRWTLSATTTS